MKNARAIVASVLSLMIVGATMIIVVRGDIPPEWLIALTGGVVGIYMEIPLGNDR